MGDRQKSMKIMKSFFYLLWGVVSCNPKLMDEAYRINAVGASIGVTLIVAVCFAIMYGVLVLSIKP